LNTAERLARLARLTAKNPRTLKYLGLEALWSVGRRTLQTFPLSWALDDAKLSRATIKWPEFVPLPDAAGWEPKLRAAFAAHVQLHPATIAHPFTSILMFEVESRGNTSRVAIDYRDSNELSDECAQSSDLYFKLQFSRDGYPFEHVLPGGYIVSRERFYRYLPWLRALRQRDSQFDVYGRFGPHGEFRRNVIERLTAQKRFSYTGGKGTVLYSQSLAEAARAKVSIDLPGHGWFCFRLPEYLAIGSCVVAVPHRNRLHVDLENGKHLAYTQSEGVDILDVCGYYLEHALERAELMNSAQEYFDRYLHYRQLGAYYLHSIVARLL
jgi:Glycosyl transferases group 1